MAHRQKTTKRHKPKTILRFPDLEHSKNAVVNSLAAASSWESYGHAIDEFIGWYCSEPRLAFNRTVVLRYRFFLEQKNLAPSTINVRLAAIRRLAYEASDSGLLSPELAAGIRRVKGAKRLGIRSGNWLTADQCRSLLRAPSPDSLSGKRDRAILAVLIGCGLRRAELVGLRVSDLQVREEHWVVADLQSNQMRHSHKGTIESRRPSPPKHSRSTLMTSWERGRQAPILRVADNPPRARPTLPRTPFRGPLCGSDRTSWRSSDQKPTCRE